MTRARLENALYESLLKNPLTCLWGMPGSGRRQLADKVKRRWASEASVEPAAIECRGITSPLLVFEMLNHLGKPLPAQPLFIQDLGLGPDQTLEVLRATEVLGWRKVLVVSNHRLAEGDGASFSSDPLDQWEALQFLTSRLSSMGLAVGPEHRVIARHIGGSLAASDAVADALAILPPAEAMRLQEQPSALLDLSPSAARLEELVLDAIRLLPEPVAGMARRWGFLGCPIRPDWQEAIFGFYDPQAVPVLYQAQLLEHFGSQYRPLPHFVWAVRRQATFWKEEHDEAWMTLARWFMGRCRQEDLATILALERRSWNSRTYVQAWSTASNWAQRAGLTAGDQDAMRLVASAHALMGDCLEEAEELMHAVPEEPSSLCGAAGIIKGTLLGFRGRATEGVEALQPAIAKAKEAGLQHLAAAGLYRLGALYMDQGQTVSAEMSFRHGAEMAAFFGGFLHPRLLDWQAFAVSFQGRYEESLSVQPRSVHLWEESGHPAAESHAKLAYARTCLFEGKVEQAEADLIEVLPRLIESDYMDDAAIAAVLASAASLVMGKYDEALLFAEKSAACSRSSGVSLFKIWGQVQKCWALLALRRDVEADRQIDELAGEALKSGFRMVYSAVLSLYSAQAARRGEHQLALFLQGSAGVEREKAARSLSSSETAALGFFLKASHAAVPPAEADALARAGSLIPAEQAVPLLMMNRDLLLRPAQDNPALPGVHLLTAREREVLDLLADSLTNKEIAAALKVTEGTVKRQVHSLAAKLKIESRFLLVQAAKRQRPATRSAEAKDQQAESRSLP